MKTPFPAGKHRKRGILNLQLLVFYQMSGVCYFQLLQGMRLLMAVAHTQIFRLPYLFRAGAAAGGMGALPPENGAKLQETLLKGPVPRT